MPGMETKQENEQEMPFGLRVFGMALLACFIAAAFAVQKLPTTNIGNSQVECSCQPLP